MKQARGRWLIVILMTILIASVLIGGVNRLFGSTHSLVESEWNLTALNGQMPGGGNEPITLQFQSATNLGGFSGCNTYGGTYTLRGDRLSMSDLVSTQMGCLDQQITNQEAAFYESLSSVDSYELANDQLILRDANGTEVLRFQRAT